MSIWSSAQQSPLQLLILGAADVWFQDEEKIQQQRWLLEKRLQTEEFDGQWEASMEEFAEGLREHGMMQDHQPPSPQQSFPV